VGRVSKEKDLDIAAVSHKKMVQSGRHVRLVFTGDGPYLPELREKFPDAHFTGYLDGPELAAAFASADIFVFPSTTDTFGNVVLEAMASGLPVVVSDRGGPKELVADGETGFVTRSLDLGSFIAATQRLAGDAALRARLGANARRVVESRDWGEALRRFWAMTSD
jgi:glycosyltransferase involved in cell wall biosynthesis